MNELDPKTASSRGGRRAAPVKSRRFSLPFIAAAIVVVAAAAFLFRSPGGDVPVGTGQEMSVLTAEPMVPVRSDAPTSGDVEINDEATDLVPEQAEASSAPTTTTDAPPARTETTETTPEETPEKTRAVTPEPEPAVQSLAPESTVAGPTLDGDWAVQYGAFGQQSNAEALMASLREKGYLPYLRTANNAEGRLVYRVWIGYFADRDAAAAFARENTTTLGEAIVARR